MATSSGNTPAVYRSTRPTQSYRAGQNINASTAVADLYQNAEFWSREQADLFQKWQSSFEKWEGSYNSPYFDYFYSGQDVTVSIEGLPSDANLPIYSFGYVIQQQKTPVYGFWSYTYDGMLRGTRIVTGAFSILVTTPNLLTNRIAQASSIRGRVNSDRNVSNNLYALRGLDDDERNIAAFWHRHYDNNLDDNQRHLFSIHPPFNFIIRHGLQETSLHGTSSAARSTEIKQKFMESTAYMSDTNERLVENPIPEEDTKVLLENVEIMEKSIQYDTSGSPLIETYTFMARDERILSPSVYERPDILPSPPQYTTNPDAPAGSNPGNPPGTNRPPGVPRPV